MKKRAKSQAAKPIENHTGQRYPGTGGKVHAPKMKDVTEEIDDQRQGELEVNQAGGEEPW